MKRIVVLLLLPLAFCGQVDFETKFIEVIPENGSLTYVVSSGRLNELEEMEIYITPFLKNRVETEQGFLVIKLRRRPDDQRKIAYQLLDSLNKVEWAKNMDIDSPYNSWSEEQKKEIRYLRDLDFHIRQRFYNEVIFHIEKDALKTGVSHKAYLTYKPYKAPPPINCAEYIKSWKEDMLQRVTKGEVYSLNGGNYFRIQCDTIIDSVYLPEKKIQRVNQ